MRWSKTFNVVGCHAEGEVGNVVTGGIIDVPGNTMFEKRLYLEREMDQVRQLLLFEPRGAAVQNANIILPSNNPEADMGFVVLESTEYPAMSGSNTMCVTTVLLETGILPMVEPVTHLTLEAPAGLIKVEAECSNGKVTGVRFTNQPAFVYHQDVEFELDGLGQFKADVAYGGMTYALVQAEDFDLKIVPEEARYLCELGQRIKVAVDERVEAIHPENPLIRGVTQTEFMGPLRPDGDAIRARNAVIVSPGRVDRSPCGTGTCARLAAMHARGQIEVGQDFIHESIIGSEFRSRVEGVTPIGDYRAVIPSVAGQAWITSIGQLGLDPSDPFSHGYTLSDAWLSIPQLVAAVDLP